MSQLRDPDSLRAQLTEWLGERVAETGVRGLVFGISGGIDSAVVCGLAAEAIGADRCLGLLLPIESEEQDLRLGREVAETFGVTALEVELEDTFRTLFATLGHHRERAERLGRGQADSEDSTSPATSESSEVVARMNLKPRLRMIALYYYANLLDYLVVGTGNRDELAVGYFTKWGDGAADLFLLGDLVKGEVRQLARTIGVPGEVISRPPSAGLKQNQTDEEELGITYEQLDRYLLTGSSGDPEVDRSIASRHDRSRHKVEPAPIPRPR